jgi:hypothetical protein
MWLDCHRGLLCQITLPILTIKCQTIPLIRGIVTPTQKKIRIINKKVGSGGELRLLTPQRLSKKEQMT